MLSHHTAFSDKTSERITFVGMLEEIRQCSFYDSDKTNLVRTGYYLWNKISRGEDLPANGRNMLVELFERYTGSILKSTHGGQAKSLFPPIGDTDESDIIFCDTANYLLAEYHLSLPDYEKASEYVSKISESGRTKEGVKTLTEKVGNIVVFIVFCLFSDSTTRLKECFSGRQCRQLPDD